MTVTDMVTTNSTEPLSAAATLRALNTVRSVVAPELNDDELRLFAMVANRSGLDVFARQLYAIKRKGRVTFQTSIDGYRSIASRTGEYDGQDPTRFGPECDCGLEVGGKLFMHPEWAETDVYRKDVSRPITGHSDWHETAPARLDDPGSVMWLTKPRLMLAKCSEAQGLRRAFPWDGNTGKGIPTGVYTADEPMDDEPATAAPSARSAVAARAASIRAETSGDMASEETADSGDPEAVEEGEA